MATIQTERQMLKPLYPCVVAESIIIIDAAEKEESLDDSKMASYGPAIRAVLIAQSIVQWYCAITRTAYRSYSNKAGMWHVQATYCMPWSYGQSQKPPEASSEHV